MTPWPVLLVAAGAVLEVHEATDEIDFGNPDDVANACVAASEVVAVHLRQTGLAPGAHVLELVGLDELPPRLANWWHEEFAGYPKLYRDPAGTFLHAIVAVGDGRTLDPTARQIDRTGPPIVGSTEAALSRTWHRLTRRPIGSEFIQEGAP